MIEIIILSPPSSLVLKTIGNGDQLPTSLLSGSGTASVKTELLFPNSKTQTVEVQLAYIAF
jgi:hypothetical protein